MATPDADDLTAARFVERLRSMQSDAELQKVHRYFKAGSGDDFIGVRMGSVFALAKEFVDLPPAEIERLLESGIHEARAGALSVMAKQYAAKKTSEARRQELFDLYLRRHDRIDNWDLVDLAAWHVVGAHLVSRDRAVLTRLAASEVQWERRTAILATMAFVRRNDLDDTFAIAGRLVGDSEDLIHKAVGGMLREAGKHDRQRLEAFLQVHAPAMPRTMLRYAIEHFAAADRARWLAR